MKVCVTAKCNKPTKSGDFCAACWSRKYRQIRPTIDKEYEKTPSGFLMRLYRNMKSRILGVQKGKAHLYKNKSLLTKDEFYAWAKTHATFLELFENYKKSNYNRKLAPSVDRVNPALGYQLDNMEWVTMSENSRRASKTRKAYET